MAHQRTSEGTVDAPGPPKLSPVVRKLLSEHALAPEEVVGTGSGGRLTRADVLAAVARRVASSDTDDRAHGDEVVRFSGIRRRTAEHMQRSLATSPHALVAIEVDYHNVERTRLAHRAAFRGSEGISLTYLPFIARAVIDAIRVFPHVNASVGADELIVHRSVNLGIAVDLDYAGLVVPVVKDAGDKRLRRLATEIADLAGRARERTLAADDFAGGTFTVTNTGPFGTLITVPIINQPQVAILATDGIRPKPVAVPTDGGGHAVAVHPVGNLCLSFDHRAYDGAYAAGFLARVKDTLETREWDDEL